MARTNLKVTDGIAIDFYDDGNSNKGSIYLDNGALFLVVHLVEM